MESSSHSSAYSRALECVDFIRKKIPEDLHTPDVGIICGSGLGGLADSVRADLPIARIPYARIPNFPSSTVAGHAGMLLFGYLGAYKRKVVLMVGRVHFYEGHSMQETSFPIRVLKLLGIQNLIVTNAAGGLNPTFEVGDLVVICDHLNLAGLAGIHPLRGPNIDEFGTRFPPLSDAYDLEFRRRAYRAWMDIQSESKSARRLHEGIYAYVGGPSYETRAECRMLRALGADTVGMSTVPEVIVARHSGIRVLAISLVTNIAVLEPGPRGCDVSIAESNPVDLAASLSAGSANHAEVLEAGREAASDLQVCKEFPVYTCRCLLDANVKQHLVFRLIENFTEA